MNNRKKLKYMLLLTGVAACLPVNEKYKIYIVICVHLVNCLDHALIILTENKTH